MSENLLLVATAMGIESRPLVGFKYQQLIKVLDLDRRREQPVQVIALAKPRTGFEVGHNEGAPVDE